MPTHEIELRFLNEETPVVIRDLDLIKKLKCIVRSMGPEGSDWDQQDFSISFPTVIQFPKVAAEFLFKHLREYKYPEDMGSPEAEAEKENSYFPEASRLTLAELKPIIEVAVFFECTEFMDCIGFVIASKLNKLKIEAFADFAGVELDPKGHFFEEADNWIHPVLASMDNLQL